MRIRAILTDLDGTLLEPDGSACVEVREVLAELERTGVPVCAMTSKAAGEVQAIASDLGLRGPASFENGAGVLLADGTTSLASGAVPIARLVPAASRVREATGAPLRTILELDDAELAGLTGLSGEALAAARDRQATLPLVVEAAWDEAIRDALPPDPPLRAVRGNRFLHLQGDHDKAGAVRSLLALTPRRTGAVVACGDSPNDVGLLALADVAVLVPGATGPNPELLRQFPQARVAPAPHGRGWATAIRTLLGENADRAARRRAPGGVR